MTKTGATEVAATVAWATAPGTATAGATCAAGVDYISDSGSLTFGPLETTKTITVKVCGDTAVESDEAFFVNLTTPRATRRSGSSGARHDRQRRRVLQHQRHQRERGQRSGNDRLHLHVTKTGTVSGTRTVNYATESRRRHDPEQRRHVRSGLRLPADSGTLIFGAGDTTQTITVLVCGDTTVELDELFNVNLSSPSVGATISDATGQGTIVNDDVSFSINDISTDEGNSGTTAFTFTVTKAGVVAGNRTVDYAPAPSAARSRAATPHAILATTTCRPPAHWRSAPATRPRR